MVNLQPAVKDDFKYISLESTTKKINETMDKVKNDFMYIGFLLWEVNHFKYYESKGYCSVVEYAEKELGFKQASTYNFISICEKFSEKRESGYPTMKLDSKFKDYNFTQLVEIKSLKIDQLDSITPDMSKKQIREKKKELKSNENNIVEVEFVADNKEVKEVQVVNFATNKVYSNPIICDERLAAAQDKKIFNNEECEKILELLTDRYKIIENFIDNSINVAPINVLQAELKLLESIMSKL